MNVEAINLILAGLVTGSAIYATVVWRHPEAAEWLAVRLLARAAAKLSADEEYRKVYKRAMGELTGDGWREHGKRGQEARVVELDRRLGQ